MRAVKVAAIALGIILALANGSAAEDAERDRCSCKFALKGAESTLRGGTCVRTESSTCLMEWGGNSNSPVPQGMGFSQLDAGQKAAAALSFRGDRPLEISRLASASDGAAPIQQAFANLSAVSPKDYFRSGMPESFLLAAGSALIRYAKGPMSFLATTLLERQRDQFISLLQKEGELKIEQFVVRGNEGCLQIRDNSQQMLLVFVKTPFAASSRC